MRLGDRRAFFDVGKGTISLTLMRGYYNPDILGAVIHVGSRL